MGSTGPRNENNNLVTIKFIGIMHFIVALCSNELNSVQWLWWCDADRKDLLTQRCSKSHKRRRSLYTFADMTHFTKEDYFHHFNLARHLLQCKSY